MSTEAKQAETNWEELSDEDFLNADSPFGGESVNELSGEDDPKPTQSEGEDEPGDVTDSEADGAATDQSSKDTDDDPKDTSASDDGNAGTQNPFSGNPASSPKDDQSKDQEKGEKPKTKGTDSDKIDWKAEYQKVMAPFKAAKREINLENPEEARRLMQMGVDYSRKMQMMKPYQRILHTLEKANLLDPERINFLIDLDAKDPEAIKKLLKDSSIDPTELELEDGESTYKPKNHAVSDSEVDIRQAFESFEGTDTFDRTVQILTKQWDTASKSTLREHPTWIPLINDHVADGTFDKVWSQVERDRMFGKLAGLSDLDAYYQTGEAMAKAGNLADPQNSQDRSSAVGDYNPASAQGNGSPDDPSKDLKRAASLTKGKPSSRGAKKAVDYGSGSDEDFLKQPPPSL